MKPLAAFAGVALVGLMLVVQTSLCEAQQGDGERLQQLEKELKDIQQELDRVKQDRKEIEELQKELEAVKQERMMSPAELLDKLHIKLGASITVRYDITHIEDQEDLRLDDNENGFRTRDRFSVDFIPDGPVQAGLRLTTGEDPNPTSPFIRMGDLFQSESFQLDRFYINLRPVQFFDERPFDEQPLQVSFLAGKFENPYWSGSRGAWRSEIIWDTDVQPEGVALKLSMPRLLPYLGLTSTTSYFIIEELNDLQFQGLTGDTYLVMTQLKADVPYAMFSFTYYDYQRLNAGLRSPSFDPASGADLEPGQPAVLLRSGLQRTNNTRLYGGAGAIGFLDDDFQVINFAAQLYYPIPWPALAPEIWFYGDYVKNLSVDNDNNGFGVTIGFRGGGKGKVLAPFNLWFTYRDVDNDATLGTYADSDLCAGTGCKGFEFGANYRFTRNFLFQIVVVDFKGFPDKENDVTRAFFDLVTNF